MSMSFMEYESPRSCLSHNIPYNNYTFDERHALLTLGHTREIPRGYTVGGPVVGMQTRTMMGREDPVVETGPARRRIAIACARCRKRKIRCSGDPGNGSGCLNCRQAGVDPMSCQFHRVGSDVVHKVMDNMAHNVGNLTNAQQMMPLYQTGSNMPLYQRSITVQYSQYPQLDTKLAYAPIWTVPFSEDTSPVDTFSLDQTQPYIANTTAMANANMYGPSWRASDLAARPLQHGGACFDQELNGLPDTTGNGRITPSDISLDTSMSSLQLSVPERPHPRQPHPSESSVPRRQLPMPQRSPAQSSRNAVDQLQDALLRSARVSGSSIVDSRGSFAKPPMPWLVDGGNQAISSRVASMNDTKQAVPQARLYDGPETPVNYISAMVSTTGDATTTNTSSQLDLTFSTSGLLDGMSAPAPATTYSYVRRSHQIASGDSPANMHGFSNNHSAKRNSIGGELPNNCTLGSSRRYTPLSHSPPQNSPNSRKSHRDSCHGRSA